MAPFASRRIRPLTPTLSPEYRGEGVHWHSIVCTLAILLLGTARAAEVVPATASHAQHWSFIAPQRPPLPEVQNKTWPRNAIDNFVLQRLEREKLSPSPEADRATLLRRVSLDLAGIPPTLEELDAFLADASPQAYEKVVDRLLASPRYGERMALAWLDAARYADTNGYNNDEDRTMWPWRDWVIDAFNRNMPYDRFIVEQLAGDLLPDATMSQNVATAFLRNQGHNTEGGIIQEEYRVEYVADRVHTTATVFLGLSMQCARCHDHKFDPISQREYYQFYAFFNTIDEKQASYVKFVAAEPFMRVPSPQQKARLEELEETLTDLRKHLAALESDPEMERGLNWKIVEAMLKKSQLESELPAVMIMREMPKPRETFILKRGQYDKPDEKVSADVPAFLPPLPADAPKNRLALARWLVDPANPLTARVAVNRWWQQTFGTGLVRTVEDFGMTGESPSHPELLDFLATQLIASGWDVKAMQKLMVMSATYRQSSRMRPELEARDPENLLLARGGRYRLSAEVVRDNALAISGLLREHVGGPSVKPYQPDGLWEDVTVNRAGHYVADTGDGLYRRSLYTFWKRTCPPPALASFDAPNREVCVARRARTNTPLQALILLNDTTYVEAARKLAERVMASDSSSMGRLTNAFRMTVAREPRDEERQILLEMYDSSLARFAQKPAEVEKLLKVGRAARDGSKDQKELAAWTVVCSTLLNMDETISRR
ncbi:MAG TPA: DUF1549 and DUF1553 domain-containing protein [Humisphaera sp.]|jgi:hypothetical protein|nr:DUF1549 and DUF1553 domain-containing protein [Humisphaera sp.]